MKLSFKILILLFLTGITTSFAQISTDCDTVYKTPEIQPVYDKGNAGLLKYFQNELGPIMSEHIKDGDQVIASLRMKLTIDKNGKVIDVLFLTPGLSASCSAELKRKLLTMEGWTPGQMNNKPVCSISYLPINCILWR